MSKWLQSGRRRDLCVLLAEGGELSGQSLKTRLEDHYGTRIEPKSFYGALDALVDSGFVETREAGIHDVYTLTDAGQRQLHEHFEWMRERIDDPASGGPGDGQSSN
ncbi:MAG: PadR family transcriptional regulator [Haloarculaceae archaeon]